MVISPHVGAATIVPGHVIVELIFYPGFQLLSCTSELVVKIAACSCNCDFEPRSMLLRHSELFVVDCSISEDCIPNCMTVSHRILASTVLAFVEQTVRGCSSHEVFGVVGLPLATLATLFLAIDDRCVETHALTDMPLATLDLFSPNRFGLILTFLTSLLGLSVLGRLFWKHRPILLYATGLQTSSNSPWEFSRMPDSSFAAESRSHLAGLRVSRQRVPS